MPVVFCLALEFNDYKDGDDDDDGEDEDGDDDDGDNSHGNDDGDFEIRSHAA